MKRKLPFKPMDFVVVGLSLALTGLSAFMVYAKPQATQQILIQGPTRSWVFPLDAEETVAVPGPLGDTVVEIHDHQAWVVSSPCDNKTCVAAGHINEEGQWVACLPNNVFVMIEGTKNDNGFPDRSSW